MMHGMGLFLLTAVAGYWLLERAQSHKGGLKTLGQWLGVTVIAISVVVVGLKLYKFSAWCSRAMGSGKVCPFMPGAKPGVKPPAP